MKQLGFRSGAVVHTPTSPTTGLDEATTTDLPYTELRTDPWKVTSLHRTGTYHRFPVCKLEDLRGKDAAYNAQVIRDIFSGHHHKAADTILLNTAIALKMCGLSGDERGCASMIQRAIDDGRAANILKELESFGREQPQHAA